MMVGKMIEAATRVDERLRLGLGLQLLVAFDSDAGQTALNTVKTVEQPAFGQLVELVLQAR